MRLTISAAARLCGVDRRTLQRAIHAGRLHLDAQHCLNREDLLAAGYLVTDTPLQAREETPQEMPHSTPHDIPRTPLLLERLITAIEGLWHEVRHLRDALGHTPQAPANTPATPTSTKDILLPQIQRWQQEGMSLRAIAHKLNTEGVPTWTGKGQWYQSNLSRALAAQRKTSQAHQAGAQRKE